MKLNARQKGKTKYWQKSLYSVAVRNHLQNNLHRCVLLLLWLQVISASFIFHVLEMLQMNYTDSRWPESKHLASFAWGFPWAAQQICTYSKGDKRGSLFLRGETVQRSQFMQMMAGAIMWYSVWGLVIKIKCSGKTGALKWYKKGSDIPLRSTVYCAWSGCYFKRSFLQVYICCLIHNSSFLPQVPGSDCDALFIPTCLTENK